MYKKLAGMTGTAVTSAEEFHKVYNLETIVVPTNMPMIRNDWPDLVFQTEKGKIQAIAEKIKKLHQKGQPVLVGTVSIEKNEYLSALLKKEGIPHRVLNAKNHEEEGEIIAQAGRKGTATIATNMAGRGVDIVLGGNPPSPEEARGVREFGGLFVLGTERHEARRIDNQLRGRSGRQGDPGETQFFVSLEDDLMRIFGSERIKNMMAKLGIPENQPIENRMVSSAIEAAQSKIEGFNFDTRKHLLEYDDVMNHQRKIIYERRRKILFGDEPNRLLTLQVMDMFWVDHLEMMDYMRSSVRLRAYGQRDPLVEYKNEGLRMFRQMEESIKRTIAEMVMKMGAMVSNPKPQIPNPKQIQNLNEQKTGRNDPCPCGSGKKYKRCHGK
jgi:preprotein translocase subunit SecA